MQMVELSNHPGDMLGDASRRRVVTSTADVLALISSSADRLGRDQRTSIERLIRHDHEFHGRRPRPGRQRTGRPPSR